MTSVAVVLAAARAKLPPGEARLLLAHVLGRPVSWLIAHEDELLAEDALRNFASLVARRAGGEPVAYLLGHREFFGREFLVSPAVLIPRPETELLVDIAFEAVGAGSTAGAAPRILDLGTGSGCIAITLALEIPHAEVTAVDLSAPALALARRNAERLGARLRLIQGDLFAAVGEERFDSIVANPPYVAADDPHLACGDLRHEPILALASGPDGLDALRRIIAGAAAHLAAGGQVWLEHGYQQGTAVRQLLAAAGFADIEQHADLAGIMRVSGGRWPRESVAA